MKISKLFNENRVIGKMAYVVFKLYHFLKDKLNKQTEFQFLGDLSPKLYVPFHPIPESNLYGHSMILIKYIKNKNDLFNIQIQHGVILGNLVQEIMINSFADTIVTYSEKRKIIVEKATKKKVVAIGPYIKYAKNRLSKNNFDILKKDLGKVLLVFPAHSAVSRTKANFDQGILIDKINEIKKKYKIDTVFINLYYADCNKEAIDFYEDVGFKVCSAGFWLSEYFVENLRTIIELSDYTLSNRVGTHVGYCVALGKPHYIFKQEHKDEFVGMKGKDELQQTIDNEYLSARDTQKIESVFNVESFVISPQQLEIVNEFWGNNIFYTPEELQNILV
jgi:hypothetical protein